MEQSPFARLAPEIRNDIYELTLTASPFIIERRVVLVNDYKCLSTTGLKEVLRLTQLHTCHPTALLQTCRQIRKEATRLFYAINTFTLLDWDSTPKTSVLSEFLDCIGEFNANAIKNLTIDVGALLIDSENVANCHVDRIASMMAYAQQVGDVKGFQGRNVSVQMAFWEYELSKNIPRTTFDLRAQHIDQSLKNAALQMADKVKCCPWDHEGRMQQVFFVAIERFFRRL